MTTEVLLKVISGNYVTMAAGYPFIQHEIGIVQSFDVTVQTETSKTFAYLYWTLIHHEFERKLFTHPMDTKDAKLAPTLTETGLRRKMQPSDNQPEAVSVDNEGDCPCSMAQEEIT